MSGWKLTAQGKAVERYFQDLDHKEVDVGFMEGGGSYDDVTTIAQVAAWNEYGTRHIPARPFLHDSIEFNRTKIQNFFVSQIKSGIASGAFSAGTTLTQLGVFTKGLVQKEIRDGMWVPNAPATVRKKGSSKPLIDTGRMRKSVEFVVKRSE